MWIQAATTDFSMDFSYFGKKQVWRKKNGKAFTVAWEKGILEYINVLCGGNAKSHALALTMVPSVVQIPSFLAILDVMAMF